MILVPALSGNLMAHDPQWALRKQRPTSLGDRKNEPGPWPLGPEVKSTALGMKELQAETILSDTGDTISQALEAK